MVLALPADLVAELADGDRGAYAVAADVLAQAQHPLGELVALSLGVSAASIARKGQVRIAQLQRELAPKPPAGPTFVHWQWGLIDQFGFVVRATDRPAEIARTLATPALTFVRSLEIRVDGAELAAIFAAVARADFPALRHLQIVDDAMTEEVTDASALLAGHARLETLHLDGAIAAIAHPALRELRLRQRPLAPQHRTRLATPALETLRWFIDDDPDLASLRALRRLATINGVAPELALPTTEHLIYDAADKITARVFAPLRARSPIALVAPDGKVLPLGPGIVTLGRSNCDVVLVDGATDHATFDGDTGVLASQLWADTRLFGVPFATGPLVPGDELTFGITPYRVQSVTR